MDAYVADKIKHVANTEVIRRLLIKFFMDKGFTESFDRHVHPSLIQDLPYIIPILSNKIEILPYAEDIDPSLGRARLGWNMFVLGNHRMYLGETYHNNLSDLARQIRSSLIRPTAVTGGIARRQTTPRRIVSFITRVMGDHEAGYVDLQPSTQTPRQPGEPYAARQMMHGIPQQFYARTTYG